MWSLHTFLVCCCCAVLRVAGARRGGCDAMLDLSMDAPPLSVGTGDIHIRSLSPWTWRMSTTRDQIPSTIWEAECGSSSVCSAPDQERQTEGQTEGQTDPRLISVPIYQDVLVLQRKHNSRCLSASFRRVTVGCTCVRTTYA